MLGERAPWWAPTRLNDAVTRRVHREIVDWLLDIRHDPHHHAREALDAMLRQLAHDLQFDADTQARTERLKERLLDHPQVVESSVDLWNALRRALQATYHDPAFLEEAKALRLQFQPKTAAEIQRVLSEVLATPPDIAAEYRQIIQP